jgi:hypothetical protein
MGVEQFQRTALNKGEVGELILEQRLEKMGFTVFRDWDKRPGEGGIDTIAYDPKTKTLYLIDKKGWVTRSINDASALSVERLGVENIDKMIATLDKHTGYSEGRVKPSLTLLSTFLTVTNRQVLYLPYPMPMLILKRPRLVRGFSIAAGRHST